MEKGVKNKMTMTHSVCQECKKEFDYDMKPGYPRKYCPECSEKKKAEFENRGRLPVIPVVRPGENAVQNAPIEIKRDVVRAAALTKIYFSNEIKPEKEAVLEIYKYFLENL